MPLPVTLGFLKEAEGLLDVMARYGRPTPKFAYRKSVMLRAFADHYRHLGQTSEWESRTAEALQLMSDLVKEKAQSIENSPVWAR